MSRRYRTLWDKEQEERCKINRTIHRGDVFYFDKGHSVGVEQQGGRPGVIVSNDACNNSSGFLLVCYLTTQPKTNLPTHVPVMCEQASICLCEQIHTLSKEKMQKYYCTLTPEEMTEIDKALVTTLGIDLNNLQEDEYNTLIEYINDLEKQLEEKDKELETYVKHEDDLITQLEQLQKELDDKNTKLEYKNETIKELKEEIYKLDKNISQDKNVSIENNSEYIKVCAERDVYMKLYYELLNTRK